MNSYPISLKKTSVLELINFKRILKKPNATSSYAKNKGVAAWLIISLINFWIRLKFLYANIEICKWKSLDVRLRIPRRASKSFNFMSDLVWIYGSSKRSSSFSVY